MHILEGSSDEALVLDGAWVDKVRLGQSVTRTLASEYTGIRVAKGVLGWLLSRKSGRGAVTVSITFGPSTMILSVPAANQHQIDPFVAALERAAKDAS